MNETETGNSYSGCSDFLCINYEIPNVGTIFPFSFLLRSHTESNVLSRRYLIFQITGYSQEYLKKNPIVLSTVRNPEAEPGPHIQAGTGAPVKVSTVHLAY